MRGGRDRAAGRNGRDRIMEKGQVRGDRAFTLASSGGVIQLHPSGSTTQLGQRRRARKLRSCLRRSRAAQRRFGMFNALRRRGPGLRSTRTIRAGRGGRFPSTASPVRADHTGKRAPYQDDRLAEVASHTAARRTRVLVADGGARRRLRSTSAGADVTRGLRDVLSRISGLVVTMRRRCAARCATSSGTSTLAQHSERPRKR